MFFINCLIHTSSNEDIKNEYRESSIKRFTLSILRPWVLLLGAWIIHIFY
jgi:hypothetical protein